MKIRLKLSHNNNSRLTFRKRPLLEWLVLLISFWSFLFDSLSLLPGPLGYLKYFPDCFLLVYLVLTLLKGQIKVQRDLVVPFGLVTLFFLYTLFVYCVRYQSIAYYLWGFRNNFRFFVVFFAFVSVLGETDVKTWIKCVDLLFWVNFLLSVFQFLIMNLRGDYLGGIFGITKGANADTIVLISIVMCRSFLMTFQGTEKIWICVLKSICSMFLIAAAELKFMFIVFVLILIGASLCTRYSWRKMLLLCVAALVLFIGIRYATVLFDYKDTLSLENLLALATKVNYSSSGDVNRLSAISSLAKNVIQNPLYQLFGMGLGNCDTSNFAVCNSVFYQQYGHLHYTWNMSAMLFLETGYVGLCIYFMFLISCGLCIYRKYKNGDGDRLNHQVALMMLLLCLMLVFYNASLRVETAYMIYMVLAIPFIDSKAEYAHASMLID